MNKTEFEKKLKEAQELLKKIFQEGLVLIKDHNGELWEPSKMELAFWPISNLIDNLEKETTGNLSFWQFSEGRPLKAEIGKEELVKNMRKDRDDLFWMLDKMGAIPLFKAFDDFDHWLTRMENNPFSSCQEAREYDYGWDPSEKTNGGSRHQVGDLITIKSIDAIKRDHFTYPNGNIDFSNGMWMSPAEYKYCGKTFKVASIYCFNTYCVEGVDNFAFPQEIIEEETP